MKIIKLSFWLNFLFVFALVFSQGIIKDNPNLDQIPLELLMNYQQKDILGTIVTTDGYDNFYMGVDFAEGHISGNPKIPTQFFNAWNTNSTYYSLDGFNWTKVSPSFGNTMRGDPVTAYDSLGNLYYQNMYGPSSIVGALIIKSTNNGQSWTSPGVISVAGNDKNWLACDQTAGPYANYIYATMTNGSAGSFYRSTNFGASFTNTATLSPHALPGMMVAVGPNVLNGNDISGGCVYAVTNSGSAYASVYSFFVSTNGGATFTLKSQPSFANYVGTYVGGRNSVQNMRTRPYPFIAADNSFGPYRGRLYLVYTSNNPAGDGNKPDIYCRYSTDQGTTWSQAVIVNDDPNSHLNHQWMPAIWCDKQTGRLYVQWMDTRDVPTSDSCYIYATFSDNGGLTFRQNQRISNAKMKIDCATCGGGGTPRYQGDYNAIASNEVTSVPIWGDFRFGSFASFAAYFPDFALTLSRTTGQIGSSNDTTSLFINVPSVKLYDKSVKFFVTVNPPPTSGSFQFTFSPDSLLTFPSSSKMTIRTVGAVIPGNYNLTINATGPNGTPVHRRDFNLTVIQNQECNQFSAKAGWNIVSIPRIPGSSFIDDLFPNRSSNAYGYNQNYYIADSLKHSTGYWIKFSNPGNYMVCGQAVSSNSIQINEGWNIIGPHHNFSFVSSVTTTPPNILASNFYNYDNMYVVADTLKPGFGYWIKSNQAGTINLPTSQYNNSTYSKINSVLSELPYIEITDKTGKSGKLFLSNKDVEIMSELPPVPPDGIFDVRFSSNNFVEKIQNELSFIINGAQYPIKIKISGTNINLKDNINGKIIDKKLYSNDEILISDSKMKNFKVSIDNKIFGFELNQNYPNPFNPSTKISFSLPEKRNIKLNIYDILGNKIQTLINQELESGMHSIDFDATNLSSGIYFYELKSNDVSLIRKMQILK